MRGDAFVDFNGGSVTLFPNTNFLCKNERPSCCRASLVIAGLLQEDGTPHSLCPVRTLKSYLAAMMAFHSFKMFVHRVHLSTISVNKFKWYLCYSTVFS